MLIHCNLSYSQTANVGTSVNIPDLQTAIMVGEINPVNGEILEDINVTGVFNINGAFTFRDSDISINSILGTINVLAESSFQNCHVDGVFGSQLWLLDETDYNGGEISVTTLAVSSPDSYTFSGTTFTLGDGILPGVAGTTTSFHGCFFYNQSYVRIDQSSDVWINNCSFFGPDANIRQVHNQSFLTVDGGTQFNGTYGITIQGGVLNCEDSNFNGTEIGIRCYLIPQDPQQSAPWIFVRDNNFNNCTQAGIHYVRGDRLIVIDNRFDNCAIGVESNPFQTDNQFVVIGLNEFKNGGTGVYSDNVNNLRVINNDFIDLSPVNNHRGVIHLEDVIGGTVRLNEVTRGTYGINLSNCDGTNVSENTCDEVSGNSLAGVINLDEGSENLTIDNNQIINSSPAFGLWSFSSTNCAITNNKFYDAGINMRFTTSPGHRVEQNEMYDGSTALLSNASHNMVISCNRMENATEGAFFRGNNMLLHYSVNRMEDNDIGLYYSPTAQSDPQFQQSNTWYNNTVEGAQNDNGNSQHVEDSRYEVPDANMYPGTGLTPSSWTPNEWFEEVTEGVLIADCLLPPSEDDDEDGDGMLTPEHDEIVALEHSIDSSNITQGEGYWMMNQMVTKSILDDHPEYLNQSSTLSNFYDAYSIELPLMSDVLSGLPVQTFVDDVPVMQFDQNGEVINLADFQNYTDGELTAFTQYSALRHQELVNQLSAVQTANTYNAMQQDYQYMLELYLEQLVNDYQLNTQETQDVTVLAEGCVGTDGSAVYVARKISATNAISINENFDCLDLSRGSLDDENFLTNQVFPNPNMGTVNFLNEENLKTIVLFDAFGRKVKKLNTENQTLVQFSIDELNAGVYYLKSPESIRTHRIVLQK